jgi:hypothetical protein
LVDLKCEVLMKGSEQMAEGSWWYTAAVLVVE